MGKGVQQRDGVWTTNAYAKDEHREVRRITVLRREFANHYYIRVSGCFGWAARRFCRVPRVAKKSRQNYSGFCFRDTVSLPQNQNNEILIQKQNIYTDYTSSRLDTWLSSFLSRGLDLGGKIPSVPHNVSKSLCDVITQALHSVRCRGRYCNIF